MIGAADGVFCLEGQWNSDLQVSASVLPTLEHLDRAGVMRYIHRDVATRDEVEYYLGRLRRKQYARYRVVYLAMHGEPGHLWLDNPQRVSVSLPELADLMNGACRDRYVYLGSCGTLNTSRRVLTEFVNETGAALVCGYTRSVDWVEASAFDILLLTYLVTLKYRTGAEKYLRGKTFGTWSEHLGLKFVYRR